jgi:2-polyprenyl-3-methyl-5-hydroxy-6-metoxy-1,4-benzoquinol methylase
MLSPQKNYAPFQQLQVAMSDSALSERDKMHRAMIRVNRWRQRLLVNTFRAKQGSVVFSGPFAGMHYFEAAEGALLPRLIGCYEAELQPTLLKMREENYQTVIDIGCAEGYYAVGLGKLFPDSQIYAHDISEDAQRACIELAKANGLAERVHVSGVFDGQALHEHAKTKTLVVCDIEGAEAELLDPVQYPAFKEVDLIVEVHECFKPGLVQTMTERFSGSHDIEWFWQSPNAHRELPDWLRTLPHLDQILCTWEWRSGPTPWAVMRSKSLRLA